MPDASWPLEWARSSVRQVGTFCGPVYTGATPRGPMAGAFSYEVGTWLSLVERTLGVGEVASSNLVVPTIFM